MLKRVLIAYAFLFSFSGAIGHNVIPHFHFSLSDAVIAHDHSDHSHGDEKQQDQDQHSGSIHLLAHFANVDIITKSYTLENNQLEKSAAYLTKIVQRISLSEHNFLGEVFHPPTDVGSFASESFPHKSLRAPPVFIA